MAAAVQVLQSASSAEALLKPERIHMLRLLTEPNSATGLAKQLKLPRQTVNYHLRELEREGLVEFVEHRLKGNCMERVVRASARSYVISPIVLGALGLEAADVRDKFSASYLISAAARTIRDVTILRQRADKAGKKLATLTAETEIRFANAEARREFAGELLNLIANLALKYHDEKSEGGRGFRILTGAYPTITRREPVEESNVRME